MPLLRKLRPQQAGVGPVGVVGYIAAVRVIDYQPQEQNGADRGLDFDGRITAAHDLAFVEQLLITIDAKNHAAVTADRIIDADGRGKSLKASVQGVRQFGAAVDAYTARVGSPEPSAIILRRQRTGTGGVGKKNRSMSKIFLVS